MVNDSFTKQAKLRSVLLGMGVVSVSDMALASADDAYVVMLDGTIVGYASVSVLQRIAGQMRHLKVTDSPVRKLCCVSGVARNLDMFFPPDLARNLSYPGLMIFLND